MALIWLFWQILISYWKFLMPRPSKWSIPGAHVIVFFKNTYKVTKINYVWFEFLWIRRYKYQAFGCRTTKCLPQKRRHLSAVILHQLHLTKGEKSRKKKRLLWPKKKNLAIHSLCFISNTVKKRLVSHFQNSIVVA